MSIPVGIKILQQDEILRAQGYVEARFTPLPDITAFELAEILRRTPPDLRYPFTLRWEGLPENLRRHFTIG